MSHLVLNEIITFLMKSCHKVVKKSKIVSQTQERLGYFVSARADRLLFPPPPPTKVAVGVFTIEKLATYH